MQKLNIKKGFTLLEILIGTMIFATVMVIATSVVNQSVGLQSKIHAVRTASEDSAKVADMVTRGIHEANGSFNIKYLDKSTNIETPLDYKSGIAAFVCTNLSCTANTTLLSMTNVKANHTLSINTLMMVNDKKIKIYFFPYTIGQSGTVHLLQYSRTDLQNGLISIGGSAYRLDQLIKRIYDDINADPAKSHTLGLIAGDNQTWGVNLNDSGLDSLRTEVLVGGYAPLVKSSTNLVREQPYIRLEVISRVGAGNDQLSYYESTIDATATSRNYTY